MHSIELCAFSEASKAQPSAIDEIIFVETLKLLTETEVALEVVVVDEDLMAHNVTKVVINVPLDHRDFAETTTETLVSNARAEASSPAL